MQCSRLGRASICQRCRQEIHAGQFRIGVYRSYNGNSNTAAQSQGNRQPQTDPYADFSDHVNGCIHGIFQLLRIGLSLKFLKVIVHPDLLAVLYHDFHSERCNDSDFSNQIQRHRQRYNSMKAEFQRHKPYRKQLYIRQRRLYQPLHRSHQLRYRLLISVRVSQAFRLYQLL